MGSKYLYIKQIPLVILVILVQEPSLRSSNVLELSGGMEITKWLMSPDFTDKELELKQDDKPTANQQQI